MILYYCTFEMMFWGFYWVKKEALVFVVKKIGKLLQFWITQWCQKLDFCQKKFWTKNPYFGSLCELGTKLRMMMIFGTKHLNLRMCQNQKKNWNIFSTMFDMFDDISWMIVLGEARGSRHLSRPKSRQVQDCTVNSDSWFLNTPGFKELSNFKADRYLWRVLEHFHYSQLRIH